MRVWSERYDRALNDVFAVQDEVTSAIIAAIGPTLRSRRARPAAGRPTANLDAYDAYLRGLHSFNKRTRDANERAITQLERATTLDPVFALGYAALAGAYVEQFFTHDPQEHWEDKAFVAIEQARSLDPGLAQIYVAKGNLLWTRTRHFPHLQAIMEYHKAIALNPSLAEAHNKLARVYWHIGLLDEAHEHLEEAMRLEPGYIDGLYRLAWLEQHRGSYQLALDLLRKVPKGSLAPGVDALIALTLLYLDRTEEGRAQLDAVPPDLRDDSEFTSVDAIFLALAGDIDRARSQLDSAVANGQHLGHFHRVAANAAAANAILGRTDEAIDWLERAAGDGFPCYQWFERDPCLRGLRDDPRFAELLRRLEAQWSDAAAT